MSVSSMPRRTGGAVLLLALLGAWLSHTVVYVHARGATGLRAELLGTPHLYMLPAAGVILTIVGLTLRGLCRRWGDLGGRLQVVRVAVERARGGHPCPAAATQLPAREPAWPRRLVSMWVAVASLQLILYVLQENLEAGWVHQEAPGLSVLWADHWAAMLIHLVTAFLLCALAVRLTVGVVRRTRALVAHQRLLRWLLLRHMAAMRVAAGVALQPPLDRFGRQLWGRPPPAAALP